MDILEAAERYITALAAGDAGGHDHFHALRVRRTAEYLAAREGADARITALAALLHDADDIKLSPETHATLANAVSFLRGQGVPEAEIGRITRIISQISFGGTGKTVPDSIEGKCVQDADRLDAIGAVGVARAFAYGGSHGRAMYDPDEAPCLDMDAETYRKHVSTTVNHFYEKLFRLRDLMNTETARRIAQQRDAFMRAFLDEFYAEWNGER